MGRKKKAPSKKAKLSKAERKSQRRHTKGPKAPKQSYTSRQEAKVKSLDLGGLAEKIKPDLEKE